MNARLEVKLTEYIMGIFNIYKIKLIFLLTLSKNCSLHSIFELVKAIFGKPEVLITFRNGNNIAVDRKEIFTKLWFYFDKLTIDTRLKQMANTLGLEVHEENGRKFLQFVYFNKNIQFTYNTSDDLLTILMALDVTFIQKKWRMIECKDSLVVDVGGNVGDTAIFFALSGARKVITIEPSSSLFEILSSAVNYQKADSIVYINNTFQGFVAGYQTQTGNVKYPYIGTYFGEEDQLMRDNVSISENVNFNDLINCDKIYNNCILKLSCAGCEYYLLNLSADYLRRFNQIVVEFNYGYKNICKKLKMSGFVVTHSKPVGTFGRSLKNHNVFLGMIFAFRQN